MPAEGGPARRFTSESSNEYVPSWSRDGRWIYYESDRSGESQLWKAPFPSGAAVQVTKDGGMTAFESPDRKFVYYTKRHRDGIWRQTIGGGPEELVVNHGHPYFWDMYDHGLCLLNASSHPPTVECLDFSTGPLRTIAVLPDDHGIAPTGPSFAVSPDGRWMLYSHLEFAGHLMSISNLHQVLGW